MVYYDKEAGAPSPAAGELSRCVLPKRNGDYLFTCGGLAASAVWLAVRQVANARPGNESAAGKRERGRETRARPLSHVLTIFAEDSDAGEERVLTEPHLVTVVARGRGRAAPPAGAAATPG